MASIIVKDLNYITTGKNQKFVSLDIGYTADEFGLSVLSPEQNVFDSDFTFLGENNSVVLLTHSYSDAYALEFFKNYSYVPDVVYAASIEENLDKYQDSVTSKNNIYSIFQKNSKNIIHNLYDIKDLAVKTNSRQHECADLYGPTIQNQLLGIVQYGNYTYGLTEATDKTMNYARSSIQNDKDATSVEGIVDNSYYMQISADDLYTYLYREPSKATSDMQKNYIPACNLANLSCNYIFELQNNDTFNDFEVGDIYGDAFPGKYAYNATYSMQLIKDNEYVSAANELNINKYLNEQGYPKQALVNCRRYVGIDKCGDTVFLKYYDDIWYNKAQEQNGNLSVVNNTHIKQTNENFQFTKYQKIETIKSINRFVPNTLHKTNMFSISIEDTGLSSDSINSKLKQLKEMMMQDIRNNIKMVVDKVCPAHTQLLNIEFK